MSVNISAISHQLDSIVASHATVNTAKASVSASSVQPSQSVEMKALHVARSNGQEQQFLESEVAKMVPYVSNVDAPLSLSVEVAENGDYFVKVYDSAGKEVKSIPSETFVQTRVKIQADIKGFIEDSKN